MSSALADVRRLYADYNSLHAAMAMMEWDQQTYMPRGGAEARSEHTGVLSRMAHEVLTSDELRTALDKAKSEAAPGSDDAAMVRVLTRDVDLATKIPSELVEEKTRLAAIAHELWVAARANNDFAGFAPTLEKMFEIAGREAEYLGYKDDIYDALLDQYEEGATADDVRAMFDAIRGPQVDLVKRITERTPTDDSALYGEWDEAKQRAFTLQIVEAVGFDLNRGRQDTAPHPFCTGWSIGDIRLTTRFKPYIGSAIFGSLHEAGHGMYEQGTKPEWDLTPLAGGISLGIHESQSRTWENIVGRSKGFWMRFLPDLQALFPQLGGFDVDTFYRAINKVEPSLIRVEADELTYNLHVLVRFEIESAVLKGELRIQDMPEAWNEKYRDYLGVVPPTDSVGCLQDVHWSQGSIGYFPTSSMGNLLSYQIWRAMEKTIPNTDELIAKGEFAPMLGWLQENVYQKGRSMPPKDLVMQVTGKPMDAADYIEGLTAKYVEVYNL